MSEAQRLLEQATPLPWSGVLMLWGANGEPGGEGHVLTPFVCSACERRGAPCLSGTEANQSLIVHAVNRLPDYEAAVDALAGLVDTNWPGASEGSDGPAVDAALAALRRLRPAVPA